MHNLSQTEANLLAIGIAIPPRPNVVLELMAEQSKPEPDLQRIAQLIAYDVSISAAVLKTINSPLYGLRCGVDSIEHAVYILGAKNIYSLVMGLALRSALPASVLQRYFDQSAHIALVMVAAAEKLGISTAEDAHLCGLFHDCGIPLMTQRFPDYKETLRLANFEAERCFLEVENHRHITNHVALGVLLARKWGLPEHIQEAIAYHHNIGVFGFDPPIQQAALDLIALIHIAAIVENAYFRASGYGEWVRFEETCRAYLGLGEQEWGELLESIKMAMDSTEAQTV